jgi:ribonuclease HI
MKQLSLFELEPQAPALKPQAQERVHWKLFIDGASRNNPGPAGAGMYILKDGEFYESQGYFLGSKTNNQAEYLALLLGLCMLKKVVRKDDLIHIVSDSQLVVRQIKGEYKVKNEELKQLHAVAQTWLKEMDAHIFHVLRIDNANADEMANLGVDKKRKVPHEFLTALQRYGISI